MLKQLAVVALSFAASPVEAQVVTEMTPELVKAAIAAGGESCYRIKTKVMMDARPAACIGTPYSRVAGAAGEARKKYQPFAEADVTPEMLAPQVTVAVFPQNRLYNKGGMVSVEAVVVMPAKSKDRAAAILPTQQAQLDEKYQNLYGAQFEARGMMATFPLSVLDEKNELRIVYDGYGCSDWKGKPSNECAVQLKLKGVK